MEGRRCLVCCSPARPDKSESDRQHFFSSGHRTSLRQRESESRFLPIEPKTLETTGLQTNSMSMQTIPTTNTDRALDKSGMRVREMFRQIAPRYDAMNHLLSLNVDRYWRWRAVKRLRFQSSVPILDTCTGTGDLAIAIQRRAPESVAVVGSDFCHAMLQIGRNKVPDGRIGFVEADSQALPFPSDTFGCVTVAFGLRNVADTDQGIREMARVCRPGGQVLILEFSQPTFWGLRQIYGFYFRHVLPRIGQWFAKNDKSAYEYLPESVGQFPEGQALADRMIAAGLLDVCYTPMTFGVATIYEGNVPPARSSNG